MTLQQEDLGTNIIQGSEENDILLAKDGKNIFLFEGLQDSLSEFRRLFVQNLNEGRFFYPVNENGDSILSYRKDIEIESPGVISQFLEDAANGAQVGGAVGGGIGAAVGSVVPGAGTLAGAGVGAAIGAAYGVAFVVGTYIGEAIFQNRTDPFVANIYLIDRVLLNDRDITEYVLNYSYNFISAYSNWSSGTAASNTLAFLNDRAFSPKVLDSNKQVVTSIFGTDTFIFSNSGGKALGFVVYNDPAITGREVSGSDDLQIDFSGLGNVISGDVISLIGSPITVSERFTSMVNADVFPTRLISNFGHDIVEGFVPGRDILQLEANLTFADFDTNHDNVLNASDANVSLSDNGLVLDVSKALGLEAGLATITLKSVTELPRESTNFSDDVSGKPVIDLRAFSGKVNVELDATKGNTLYDDVIGFYKVLDSKGGIDITNDGNADLYPGDSGYISAAIQNREPNIAITGSTKITASLEGGSIYAPFIAANTDLGNLTSANTYFGFSKANPDGRSHVQLIGNNSFGFEDLPWLGDRSFNDMIVTVTTPR
jgi:hypothetical protein